MTSEGTRRYRRIPSAGGSPSLAAHIVNSGDFSIR